MEAVPTDKLKEINEAALIDTRNGIATLVRTLMQEKNLRADQVEIVQEVTPAGVRIFVQEKQPTKGERP